jgi:hypothetical protein
MKKITLIAFVLVSILAHGQGGSNIFQRPVYIKDSLIVDSAFQFKKGASNGAFLNSDATGHAIWVSTDTIGLNITRTIDSLAWLLGGNTGTNPSVNYLGTTDSTQFYARSWFGNVNNQSFMFLRSPKSRTVNSGLAFLALRDSLHNNGGVFNLASTGFDVISSNAAEDTDVTVHGSWKTKVVSIVSNQGDAKVGIGTTSPDTTLHVIGKTKTTNFQMTSGAAAGSVLTSDALGNASWGGTTIYHVRDSISSTQILNSYTSPDTLIAAPGAGYSINVNAVRYYYAYNTAAYTIASTADIFEGDTINPISKNLNTTLKTAASPVYGYSTIGINPNSSPIGLPLNQAISFDNKPLRFYSRTSNPTGGSGYVIVYIDYTIQKD